jgi:hypothetical protein
MAGSTLVLVDNVVKEHDGDYILGINLGRKVKVAFHGSDVLNHYIAVGKENVKLVTQGHLYVLNYNVKTFVPTYPMTYEEFKANGSKL